MKRFFISLAFFATVLPVNASNLLTNGGFDADLSGWTVTPPAGISVDWKPLDATGSASGTARAVSSGIPPSDELASLREPGAAVLIDLAITLTQRVPLGTWHSGAKLRSSMRWLTTATGGAPSNSAPGFVVSFYDSLGARIGTSTFAGGPTVPLALLSWRKAQIDILIPAGAVSAEMRPGIPTNSGFTAHFDDASFEIVYGDCVESTTSLCLSQGRFQVSATWSTSDGASGNAQAVRLTTDTGYFWFFNKDNVEVVIKALNACTLGNYWVFASGLTDVSVELTVRDTLRGSTKKYSNPQKTPFAPVQDTSAFATCP